MKFSLLVEAQLAEPSPVSEAQLFHDIVAQAQLADELGYHAIWAVEHHGLYEYSHCSAPEVLLSYIAARTRRIRLGQAVSLTPGRYNHPIRVAERVATLDILSEGRVNWGSGKSASRTEQEVFEIDRETLDSQWREALEMIPRMWRSDSFEYSGRHYNIPPTTVIPKPVQKPHPPVMVGGDGPRTLERVVEYGDEWMPIPGRNAEPLESRIAELQSMARAAGRGTIPVSLFGVPGDPGVIENYEKMGVHRVCFRLPSVASEEAISVSPVIGLPSAPTTR